MFPFYTKNEFSLRSWNMSFQLTSNWNPEYYLLKELCEIAHVEHYIVPYNRDFPSYVQMAISGFTLPTNKT